MAQLLTITSAFTKDDQENFEDLVVDRTKPRRTLESLKEELTQYYLKDSENSCNSASKPHEAPTKSNI